MWDKSFVYSQRRTEFIAFPSSSKTRPCSFSFCAFVVSGIVYSELRLAWENDIFQFFLSHNHSLFSGCQQCAGWPDGRLPDYSIFSYILINVFLLVYRGIIPCVFKPRLSFVQSDHLLDKKQPARLINSKITHHHLGSQNRFTWNCLKQKRNVFGIRKYKSAMKDGINMISVYTSRPTQLFTYCNTATCFGPPQNHRQDAK